MKILVRTYGGFKIGLGHFFRCLNLAYALKLECNECEIIFIVNKEIKKLINGFKVFISENFDENDFKFIQKINPDSIILDSYIASQDYVKNLYDNFYLVMFDDNNDLYKAILCDILINGNLHAEKLKYFSKNEKTIFLLGPKYLVMKKEYWNLPKNLQTNSKSILVTTGGTDFRNLMPKFIEKLKEIPYSIKLIIGPLYDREQINNIKKKINRSFELIHKPSSLKEHIINSQLVISTTGSTIYEILALKRIPIIYSIAENQLSAAHLLEKYNIDYLGWYSEIKWDQIKHIITRILHNKQKVIQNLLPLFQKIDGKGAIRVSKIILENFKIFSK